MRGLSDNSNEQSQAGDESVELGRAGGGWRLLRGQRQFPVGPGTLTMGRGFDCGIVIDSPGASRLHARLLVSMGTLTIEDAGSTNGVYVNGERVKFSRDLAEGDRILIGTVEYVVAGSTPVAAEDVPGSEPAAPPKAIDDDKSTEPDLADTASTSRCDALVTVGRLADRMLVMGRTDAAVKILANHLAAVLDNAKKTGAAAPSTLATATQYAMKLAGAANDARWVDYVIEMHLAANRLAEPELVRQIQQRVSKGVRLNPGVLALYKQRVSNLMEQGDEFDRMIGEMVLAL